MLELIAGAGFSEQDRERVFEPFYRGREPPEGRGAGLGLALIREIAKFLHGAARGMPRDGGAGHIRSGNTR